MIFGKGSKRYKQLKEMVEFDDTKRWAINHEAWEEVLHEEVKRRQNGRGKK